MDQSINPQQIGADPDETTCNTDPTESAHSPESKPEAHKSSLPDIPVSSVKNVKTQEELDEVLKSHALWVEQVLDPNVEIATGRANLSGVDLRGFSLKGVNLSGANLSKANLAEVDLTGANLAAANLQGATLACANLSGVKLRGAKLSGADLRGADLTGAHVNGVDFSSCLLKTPEPKKSLDQDPPPPTPSKATDEDFSETKITDQSEPSAFFRLGEPDSAQLP